MRQFQNFCQSKPSDAKPKKLMAKPGAEEPEGYP
jgi:hypothetical protein